MISLAQFRPSRQTVTRFILTVLIASIFHAVACIIKRPFEFGNLSRLHTFRCALISGLISFPILFAVLLLPLRAAMRRCMPQAAQHVHAVVATLVLLALVATWLLARYLSGTKLPAFCHGWSWHSLFWLSFAIVTSMTFFWPTGARTAPSNQPRNDDVA